MLKLPKGIFLSCIFLLYLNIYLFTLSPDLYLTAGTFFNPDGNIYGDASKAGDNVTGLALGFGYQTKFFRNLRLDFRDSFTLKSYSKYKYENNFYNAAGLELVKEMTELLSISARAGFDLQNYSDAARQAYDLAGFSFNPYISFYPLDYTDLDLGLRYEKTNYAGYEYDRNSAGMIVRAGQEFSRKISGYLSFSYSVDDYPEYRSYSSTSAYSDNLRKDNLLNFAFDADWEFSRKVSLSMGISGILTDSSCNARVYTASGYRIIENYFSSTLFSVYARVFLVPFPSTRVGVNISQTLTAFSERPALLENQTLSDEKRDDFLTEFSLSAAQGLVRDLLDLNFKINYDKNNSNDFWYDYSRLSFSAGFSILF